jgi:hypothetical protein
MFENYLPEAQSAVNQYETSKPSRALGKSTPPSIKGTLEGVCETLTLLGSETIQKMPEKGKNKRIFALLDSLCKKLTYLLEDNNTNKQNWVTNLYNDAFAQRGKFAPNKYTVTIGQALDGGKASKVYEATFHAKTNKADDTGSAKGVFKEEPRGHVYDGDELKNNAMRPMAPSIAGIDSVGSRLSNRAVASSKLDKDFGTNCLARTRFAMAEVDRFGTLQNWTGGKSIKDLSKEEREKKYANPDVVKGLLSLQLLDYVCGQLDRHPDNIHITEHGGVLGIDHDFSFGKNEAKRTYGTHFKPMPKYVDAAVADKVLAYTPEKLRQRVGLLLAPAEVDVAGGRLMALQNALREGSIIIVKDWSKFVSTLGRESGLHKDSYLYRST